jgi:hypothetical protein
MESEMLFRKRAVATTLQDIIDNRAVHLAEYWRRLAIVRDFVRGVARQYATGLYLYGRPGTNKTHAIRAILKQQIREIYVYQRGHLTPTGLFEVIAANPDELIVLEDVGAVLKSDVGVQVLLSALEHPKSRDGSRVVKYQRRGREYRVDFRGGLIFMSNRQLHDDDILEAFKSRVHTFNYDPSDAQLGALMLEFADPGWPGGPTTPNIPPDAAREVVHYLIGEMLRLSCPFDLRLLVDKAFADYQQWKDGEAESDWRDLVTAGIEEHLVAVRYAGEPPVSREARKEEEHTSIQKIVRDHASRDERVRAWVERTGKSARAFYRRLAELR